MTIWDGNFCKEHGRHDCNHGYHGPDYKTRASKPGWLNKIFNSVKQETDSWPKWKIEGRQILDRIKNKNDKRTNNAFPMGTTDIQPH